MTKSITLVGLGKMGIGMAQRLLESGWTVRGYDRNPEIAKQLESAGMIALESLEEIREVPTPRLTWIMVPAGKPVDDVLAELSNVLEKGDIVIDGGNSFFEDSIARGERLAAQGLRFIDVGFSGGPRGGREGGCLMVGGDESAFKELEPLFQDLAQDRTAYAFFPGAGAGHFVKMVHNGIEYAMMQGIAEGFAVLKKGPFNIDLLQAAQIYKQGSVVTSRLIDWTAEGLKKYGADLEEISGSVGHSGEGKWTIETARKFGIPVPAIEAAFEFRVQSAQHPNFIGQMVSMMRNMFGGHDVSKK
ncbi:MAG: decarboxylating 6-phosphogluconate dehydrogenase [Candidatus Kaiserbacteria bacterium]|nr:decarboxylating 6-phosphogluconate dehydrogenase [Candidatus Kaiserbacteria bacterium]